MSPPDLKGYEFHPKMPSTATPTATPQSAFKMDRTLPPISDLRSQPNFPSPPISPESGHLGKSKEAAVVGENTQDPVLYPSSEPGNDEPLFQATDTSPADNAIVSEHIASRDINGIPPSRAEYLLTLEFRSTIAHNFKKNPLAWAIRERELFERQYSSGKTTTPSTPLKSLKKIAPAPPKIRRTQPEADRITRPARVRKTPKSTPKEYLLDDFGNKITPSPKARAIGVNRDDVDYNALPDYAPSMDTLRGNSKTLKTEWKGQILDLSTDPDRLILDPAEVNLAATLRLSCATYLCSKRRIFEARLNALRIGKEFRKTDAQQACKIDVNKASKLWTAYEKVGWFRPEHFQKFL